MRPFVGGLWIKSFNVECSWREENAQMFQHHLRARMSKALFHLTLTVAGANSACWRRGPRSPVPELVSRDQGPTPSPWHCIHAFPMAAIPLQKHQLQFPLIKQERVRSYTSIFLHLILALYPSPFLWYLKAPSPAPPTEALRHTDPSHSKDSPCSGGFSSAIMRTFLVILLQMSYFERV